MRARATCLLTVAVAVMGLAARPSTTVAALTVRLYDAAAVPDDDLLTARLTAESILRDAGLMVAMRQCGRQHLPAVPIEACDTPLTPSEVVVRVINAPAFTTALNADAYGVAYVVQETGRGWLATVFADRTERAAARAGVQWGTVLGRVMAHEVGHLLLGRGYHAVSGVMRAEWPDGLLGRDSRDWRFSLGESARMHRLLVLDKFDPS